MQVHETKCDNKSSGELLALYPEWPHRLVAAHAAVARSSPAEVALIYTMHVALRGYCP